MDYGFALNLNPTLFFSLLRQMIPVLARTPIYRHVGPTPESRIAEDDASQYVQDLRQEALASNNVWDQRLKGVWAGVRQFGTLTAAGLSDTLGPIPQGFSQCLIQKECRALAVATQDIVGDTLNFLTMAPAQLAVYFSEDHSRYTVFDRAYAGTQTTILGGFLAANILGISKIKMPTQTPGMMPPPVFQLGYDVAMAPSMSIDGLPVGKLGIGIVMMDAAGGGAGGGHSDRVSSDDIREVVHFNPASPGQMMVKAGVQKRKILQQVFDAYRGMAMAMMESFKRLQEGRLSPEAFLKSVMSARQEVERKMQAIAASSSTVPFDNHAMGTLTSCLRSQFVETLRFAIRDLFRDYKEGPLVLPQELDGLLKGWSRQIEELGWQERDQGLLISQLDSLYNIDLTLVRVRKGVYVPLEHVMAGLERAAYQAIVDYEQMAKVLRVGTTERVVETVLLKVAQSFERTGVLMEAAAEKIRRGESTRITPGLGKMMDALPVYATQLGIVADFIPDQKWSLLSQCRSFLLAYPTVMGRPLPPEAAALARHLNAMTN